MTFSITEQCADDHCDPELRGDSVEDSFLSEPDSSEINRELIAICQIAGTDPWGKLFDSVKENAFHSLMNNTEFPDAVDKDRAQILAVLVQREFIKQRQED